MKDIPKDKIVEMFESLPESTQDVLLGDEFTDFTYEEIKRASLKDDQLPALSTLLGNFIMGLSSERQLEQELQDSMSINSAEARNVINRLKNNVLRTTGEQKLEPPTIRESVEPLNPSFAKDESLEFLRAGKSPKPPTPFVNSTPPPPPPPSPPQQTRAQASTVQPQEFKSITDEEPADEAPLILHKEEEVEPAKETPSYSTQRPAFYKPTFSEEYKRNTEAESAARVELGEETKKVQPQIGRTSGEPSRIVHYSEFRTPLSPFEGAQPVEPQEETPKEKPTQIHPNNVVDLKDLPLK